MLLFREPDDHRDARVMSLNNHFVRESLDVRFFYGSEMGREVRKQNKKAVNLQMVKSVG